jgi:hypothetical protein
MKAEEMRVRPDSKGRVCLGKLAEGVSSFLVTLDSEGHIVLYPYSEVPAREKWLWENREALAAVKEGLEQSENGQRRYRGSFAQYADDEIE